MGAETANAGVYQGDFDGKTKGDFGFDNPQLSSTTKELLVALSCLAFVVLPRPLV